MQCIVGTYLIKSPHGGLLTYCIINKMTKKKLAVTIVGLGEIGLKIGSHLRRNGFAIAGFDIEAQATAAAEKKGINTSTALKSAVLNNSKTTPKIVWLSVPSRSVDTCLKDLKGYLQPGDIIIDSSNSFFKETVTRGNELSMSGIELVDVGLTLMANSPKGAIFGVSAGGDAKTIKSMLPLLETIGGDSFEHVGDTGAGHLVKSIQGAVEYGVMGALAEGVEILEHNEDAFKLNIANSLRSFKSGGLVSHRLLDWLTEAYDDPKQLESIASVVPRPEVEMEIEYVVSGGNSKVIKAAAIQRKTLHLEPSTARILISAMRNEFSGLKTLKDIKESKGKWGSTK